MIRRVVRNPIWCWLVPLAAIVSAAEPLPPVAKPLSADRLVVHRLDGAAVPFADQLGSDGRAVCFAFLHPACPLAQEYAPVLGQLAEDFAKERMRFVGVACECDDPAEVEAYRTKFGLTFPIHLDTGFTLADLHATSVAHELGAAT